MRRLSRTLGHIVQYRVRGVTHSHSVDSSIGCHSRYREKGQQSDIHYCCFFSHVAAESASVVLHIGRTYSVYSDTEDSF